MKKINLLSMICIYNSYSDDIVKINESDKTIKVLNDYIYINFSGLSNCIGTKGSKDGYYYISKDEFEKNKDYLEIDNENYYYFSGSTWNGIAYYNLYNVKRYKIDAENIEKIRIKT